VGSAQVAAHAAWHTAAQVAAHIAPYPARRIMQQDAPQPEQRKRKEVEETIKYPNTALNIPLVKRLA
jgi:hypothetical protein